MDKRINLFLPDEAHRAMVQLAAERHVSVSELIREAVAAHTGIPMPQPLVGGHRPNAGRKHRTPADPQK